MNRFIKKKGLVRSSTARLQLKWELYSYERYKETLYFIFHSLFLKVFDFSKIEGNSETNSNHNMKYSA